MKVRKFKKITSLWIYSSIFAVSLSAYAGDLKIVNSTEHPLSFYINHACSDQFGIVDANSIKVIPETNFNAACKYNSSECIATVYQSTHCSGLVIAALDFDTRYGVQSILVGGPYSITASGFTLSFNAPLKKSSSK